MKTKHVFDWIQNDLQYYDDHDTDIGPVRPGGYPRHKHHRGKVDTEDPGRILHAVQRNLDSLTHQVPMVTIEDLPEAIQRRVVGVP